VSFPAYLGVGDHIKLRRFRGKKFYIWHLSRKSRRQN